MKIMKNYTKLILLIILGLSVFSGMAQETITTTTATDTDTLIGGMGWVAFLSPIIIYLATLAAKALLKLNGAIVLFIVPALSAVLGYVMQVAGETDKWLPVMLLGLASVFINELLKKLTSAKKI